MGRRLKDKISIVTGASTSGEGMGNGKAAAFASRHPWESIGRHLRNAMKELFFGIAYLAVGER